MFRAPVDKNIKLDQSVTCPFVFNTQITEHPCRVAEIDVGATEHAAWRKLLTMVPASVSAPHKNVPRRLPFDHRGVIRSHDLKCTSGSFSLAAPWLLVRV